MRTATCNRNLSASCAGQPGLHQHDHTEPALESRQERRLGMSQAAGSAARGDLQAKAERWRKLRT
jgi:hypothetical protein